MRVAVVTAYHKEPEAIVRRCVESVASQSVPVTHFVVSDGFPRPFLDDLPLRHVTLGAAHGDAGDTPRAVGSMLAAREDFDAITYLDVDNYYLADHIELMCEAQASADAEVVAGTRFFVRPDNSVLPYPENDPEQHVDTNCMFITRPAFDAVAIWGSIPKPFSIFGDRVIWAAIKARGYRRTHVSEPTIAYSMLWASAYRACGETPPPEAKDGSAAVKEALKWWRALTDAERQGYERQFGMKLNFDVAQDLA